MKGNPTGPEICRVTILSVRRKSEPSAEARLVSSLSIACPIPALSGSRVHEVPRNRPYYSTPCREAIYFDSRRIFSLCLCSKQLAVHTGEVQLPLYWELFWEQQRRCQEGATCPGALPCSPGLRQTHINKVTKTKEQQRVENSPTLIQEKFPLGLLMDGTAVAGGDCCSPGQLSIFPPNLEPHGSPRFGA